MKQVPRWLRVVLILAFVAVAVRAALPAVLESYVNRVLDRTESYRGHVEDVDLALWRGGYAIEGLRLDHQEEEELRPLISARRVDLSIAWRALLRGELVAEVDVSGLRYNVVAARPASDEMLAQTGEDPDLAERLSELSPFTIDRLEIRDGEIHYRDPWRSPKVDVALTNLHLLAVNWSNVRDREKERFGRAWVEARAFASGRVVGSLEADPVASPPDFELAVAAEGIELAELNDFLRAYGGFDADRGQLAVYAEVRSRDGRFDGYVKPLISNLDVLGSESPGESWIERVWEGVVGAVAEAFENQVADRQATRIPIRGSWESPTPNLIAAIGNVLYNAFVEALTPSLEHPEELTGE